MMNNELTIGKISDLLAPESPFATDSYGEFTGDYMRALTSPYAQRIGVAPSAPREGVGGFFEGLYEGAALGLHQLGYGVSKGIGAKPLQEFFQQRLLDHADWYGSELDSSLGKTGAFIGNVIGGELPIWVVSRLVQAAVSAIPGVGIPAGAAAGASVQGALRAAKTIQWAGRATAGTLYFLRAYGNSLEQYENSPLTKDLSSTERVGAALVSALGETALDLLFGFEKTFLKAFDKQAALKIAKKLDDKSMLMRIGGGAYGELPSLGRRLFATSMSEGVTGFAQSAYNDLVMAIATGNEAAFNDALTRWVEDGLAEMAAGLIMGSVAETVHSFTRHKVDLFLRLPSSDAIRQSVHQSAASSQGVALSEQAQRQIDESLAKTKAAFDALRVSLPQQFGPAVTVIEDLAYKLTYLARRNGDVKVMPEDFIPELRVAIIDSDREVAKQLEQIEVDARAQGLSDELVFARKMEYLNSLPDSKVRNVITSIRTSMEYMELRRFNEAVNRELSKGDLKISDAERTAVSDAIVVLSSLMGPDVGGKPVVLGRKYALALFGRDDQTGAISTLSKLTASGGQQIDAAGKKGAVIQFGPDLSLVLADDLYWVERTANGELVLQRADSKVQDKKIEILKEIESAQGVSKSSELLARERLIALSLDNVRKTMQAADAVTPEEVRAARAEVIAELKAIASGLGMDQAVIDQFKGDTAANVTAAMRSVAEFAQQKGVAIAPIKQEQAKIVESPKAERQAEEAAPVPVAQTLVDLAESNQAKAREELEQVRAQYNQLAAERKQLADQAKALNKEVDQRKKQLAKLKEGMDSESERIKELGNAKREAAREAKRLEKEVDSLTAKIAALDAKIKRANEALAVNAEALAKRRAEYLERADDAERALEEARAEIARLDAQIEAAQKELQARTRLYEETKQEIERLKSNQTPVGGASEEEVRRAEERLRQAEQKVALIEKEQQDLKDQKIKNEQFAQSARKKIFAKNPKAKLAGIEQQINEAQTELTAIKAKIKQAESGLKKAEKDYEKAQKDADEIQQSRDVPIKEVLRVVEEARARGRAAKETIDRLREEIDLSKFKQEQLEGRIERLKQEAKSYKKLAELEDQYEKAVQEVSLYVERRRELNNRLWEAKAEVERAAEELKQLKQQGAKAASEEVEAAAQRAKELKEEISRMKEAEKSLLQQRASLLAQSKKYERRVNAIQKLVDRIDQAIRNAKRATGESAKATVDALVARREVEANRLEKAQKSLDKAIQEINGLDEKISKANEELQKLSDEYKSVQEAIANTQAALEEIEQKSSNIGKQISKSSEALKEKNKAYYDAQRRLKEAKAQYSKVQKELKGRNLAKVARYDADAKILWMYSTTSPDELLRTWFYHIVENNLLPKALHDQLLSALSDPASPVRQWTPERLQEAADAFLAYITQAQPVDRAIMPAYTYMRGVIYNHMVDIAQRIAPKLGIEVPADPKSNPQAVLGTFKKISAKSATLFEMLAQVPADSKAIEQEIYGRALTESIKASGEAVRHERITDLRGRIKKVSDELGEDQQVLEEAILAAYPDLFQGAKSLDQLSDGQLAQFGAVLDESEFVVEDDNANVQTVGGFPGSESEGDQGGQADRTQASAQADTAADSLRSGRESLLPASEEARHNNRIALQTSLEMQGDADVVLPNGKRRAVIPSDKLFGENRDYVNRLLDEYSGYVLPDGTPAVDRVFVVRWQPGDAEGAYYDSGARTLYITLQPGYLYAQNSRPHLENLARIKQNSEALRSVVAFGTNVEAIDANSTSNPTVAANLIYRAARIANESGKPLIDAVAFVDLDGFGAAITKHPDGKTVLMVSNLHLDDGLAEVALAHEAGHVLSHTPEMQALIARVKAQAASPLYVEWASEYRASYIQTVAAFFEQSGMSKESALAKAADYAERVLTNDYLAEEVAVEALAQAVADISGTESTIAKSKELSDALGIFKRPVAISGMYNNPYANEASIIRDTLGADAKDLVPDDNEDLGTVLSIAHFPIAKVKIAKALAKRAGEKYEAALREVEEHYRSLGYQFQQVVNSMAAIKDMFPSAEVIPLPKNSDPTYKVTVDPSSICPRALRGMAVMEEARRMMAQEGYSGNLPQNIRQAIEARLNALGYMLKCYYCYVFTRRITALQRTEQMVEALILGRGAEGLMTERNKPLWDAAIAEAKSNPNWLTEFYAIPEYLQISSRAELERKGLLKALSNTAEEFAKKYPAIWALKQEIAKTGTMRRADASIAIAGQIVALSDNVVNWLMTYGGLRLNSNTDFHRAYTWDYIQTVVEANIRGLGAHLYTKDIDLVRLYRNSGVKMNLSVAPMVDGGKMLFDSKGNPILNTGIGSATAENARELFELAPDHGGLMMLGIDDAVLDWATTADHMWALYSIPWHSSGMPKSLSETFRISYDAKDYHDPDEKVIVWDSKSKMPKHLRSIAMPVHDAQTKELIGYVPDPEGISAIKGFEWYADFVKETFASQFASQQNKKPFVEDIPARMILPPGRIIDQEAGEPDDVATEKYMETVEYLGLKPVFNDSYLEGWRERNPGEKYPRYYWRLKKHYARTDTPFLPPDPKALDFNYALELTEQYEKSAFGQAVKVAMGSVLDAAKNRVLSAKERRLVRNVVKAIQRDLEETDGDTQKVLERAIEYAKNVSVDPEVYQEGVKFSLLPQSPNSGKSINNIRNALIQNWGEHLGLNPKDPIQRKLIMNMLRAEMMNRYGIIKVEKDGTINGSLSEKNGVTAQMLISLFIDKPATTSKHEFPMARIEDKEEAARSIERAEALEAWSGRHRLENEPIFRRSATQIQRWMTRYWGNAYMHIDMLIGRDGKGPLRDIARNMKQGVRRVTVDRSRWTEFLYKTFEEAKFDLYDMANKVMLAGYEVTMSEALGLYALSNAGQDYNSPQMLKLARSGRFVAPDGSDRSVDVAKAAVKLINEKYPALRDAIYKIDEYARRQYEDARVIAQKLGYDVPPAAFGLYMPIQYEDGSIDDISIDAHLQRAMANNSKELPPWLMPRELLATGSGMVLDYFSLMDNHMHGLIHFRNNIEWVHEAMALLKDEVMPDGTLYNPVREAIRKRFGSDVYFNALADYVKRAQSPHNTINPRTISEYNLIERGLRFLRTNLIPTSLSMNPYTVMSQTISLSHVIGNLEPRYAARFLTETMRTFRQIIKNVNSTDLDTMAGLIAKLAPEHASLFRNYAERIVRAAKERLRSRFVAAGWKIGNIKVGEKIESGYVVMNVVDAAVRWAAWKTAYEIKKEELARSQMTDEEIERTAIEFADMVVSESLNPSDPNERPMVLSEGTEYEKILLAMTGQPLAEYRAFVQEFVAPALVEYRRIRNVGGSQLAATMGALKKNLTMRQAWRWVFTVAIPGIILGLITRKRAPTYDELLFDMFVGGLINKIPVVGGLLWTHAIYGVALSEEAGAPGPISNFIKIYSDLYDTFIRAIDPDKVSRMTPARWVDSFRKSATITFGIPDFPFRVLTRGLRNIESGQDPIEGLMNALVPATK